MPDWTLLFESEATVSMFVALNSRSLASLAATCRRLRLTVHKHASAGRIRLSSDISLLGSQSWPELRQLVLSNAQDPLNDVAIIASQQLPALQTLDFSHNPMLSAAVQQLAHSTWPQLASLDLAATFGRKLALCEAVNEACRCLASAHLPQLTALNVSKNGVSALGVAELAKGAWPRLQALDLSSDVGRTVGSGIVAELARAPWPAMQDLNLRSNQLTAEDALQLSKLPWTQLTRLNIGSCFKHAETCREPTHTACWHHIVSADWPQLIALDVSNNALYGPSLAELCKGCWPELQSLDLSRNVRIAHTAFAEGLVWTRLASLSMRHWLPAEPGLGSQFDFTRNIAQLAHVLPHLTALDISGISFKKPALQALLALRTLQELRLGGSGIFDMSYDVSVQHTQLRGLDLSNRALYPAEVYDILQSCGSTLNTLSVLCTVTEPIPYDTSNQYDLWPPNTNLDLIVRASMCVLQTLFADDWPATLLRATRLTRKGPISLAAMKEMFKSNWFAVHELNLAGLKIGQDHYMPVGRPSVFCGVSWPVLRVLDLSCNFLRHDHISALVKGNWPLLEVIDLHKNELEQVDMQHLVHGQWPMLTHIDMRRNNFNMRLRSGSTPSTISILECLRRKWPSLSVCFGMVVNDRIRAAWSPRFANLV